MKLKGILSLFVTIALLGGLFAPPASADISPSQYPNLPAYFSILSQYEPKTYQQNLMLPDGQLGWPHFDRGQLVYGYPWDVQVGPNDPAQGWKTNVDTSWQSDNADDWQQAPDGSSWAIGLEFSKNPNYRGPYTGEPRYLGYDAGLNPVSNEDFPIDVGGAPIPSQVILAHQPWNNVSNDPNYHNGSGWPSGGAMAISDAVWSIITEGIAKCYIQFNPSDTNANDSFTNNPTFQNGKLTPANIENYFELLTMPDPGIEGTLRFWHSNTAGEGPYYYKDIQIDWPVSNAPNYYLQSITPFSGTQSAGSTETVNGQTAAIYNPNGAQYTYTGTVTFGTAPMGYTAGDVGEMDGELWSLVSTAAGISANSPPEEGYEAPVAVCVNSLSNFATITTNNQNFQPGQANEKAGGSIGVDSCTILQAQNNGTFTATFTWSIPQGFVGTSIPIGAGINDGWNDIDSMAQEDIIPDDVTDWYVDFMESYLTDNFTYTLLGLGGSNTTATSVPVIGAHMGTLSVTPPTDTINVGQSAYYTAMYTPPNGTPYSVTQSGSFWSDSDPSSAKSFGEGIFQGESAGGPIVVEAQYTPPGGIQLTATASLTVQGQQQQQPGNGYNGTLTFQATSQSGTIDALTGQPGAVITRTPNTAKWTDQVTATLKAGTPPEPQLASNEKFDGFNRWQITGATLSYPLKNPGFTFGDPVDPVNGATTSTGMSRANSGPPQATATAQFQENWSMDGADIYDLQTQTTMASNSQGFYPSAAFAVQYTYTYQVWQVIGTNSDGSPIWGWGPPQIGTGTVHGTAAGTLTVDGTGVNSLAD